MKANAGELSTGVILHRVAIANEGFEQTTWRLLRLAELAHGQRDFAALQELSAALQSIPFAPAQRAASYYQAVIIKQQGDLDRAAGLLSTISAPRAVQTLATIYEARGDYKEAARLHVEAMRQAHDRDGLAMVNASAQLAIIKSIEGDHAGALLDLQQLWPMVRAVASSHGFIYVQWCNAVAVELGALGRADEARAAVAIALASPIADRYREFTATADELREPEPASVRVAVVEPQRAEKRRAMIFIAPLVTCHLSLISRQWSVGSGRRSLFTVAIIRTRAASRASPHAPPSFV